MNGKPTEPVTRPLHLTLLARDGKILLYWGLFILLTGLAWYFFYRLHLLLPPTTIIYPLGIFLVAAFLTLLLGRALSAVRISLAWRYRSAFLAGLLTSLAIVLFSLAVRSVPPTRVSFGCQPGCQHSNPARPSHSCLDRCISGADPDRAGDWLVGNNAPRPRSAASRSSACTSSDWQSFTKRRRSARLTCCWAYLLLC